MKRVVSGDYTQLNTRRKKMAKEMTVIAPNIDVFLSNFFSNKQLTINIKVNVDKETVNNKRFNKPNEINQDLIVVPMRNSKIGVETRYITNATTPTVHLFAKGFNPG